MTNGWFDVERSGLRKVLEARGKSFAVLELLQNAWDADGVTRVSVVLTPIASSPKAALVIEDDSPVGFQHLAHAWTLFAESNRKANAEKRGRFNLGEKLVLAMCDEATIETVTGAVRFDDDGRHILRRKRERGSVFSATLQMTREEIRAALSVLRSVIPPTDVSTTVNDVPIRRAPSIASVAASLPTEVADGDGVLRRSRRNTIIEIWPIGDGETAYIYEMGIPIVETGDKWHYNIAQKVPLNMNRDNVTPAYLQEVRTAVLNGTFDRLTEADSKERWVSNAIEDDAVEPVAVRVVVQKRFGDRAVVFDPSDHEANNRAVMLGYAVIPGGSLSASAWSNVRASEALLPAGRVTPTPKPFSTDGKPLNVISPSDYTNAQRCFVEYVRWLAPKIIGREVSIRLAEEVSWGVVACYGDGELHVNVAKTSLTDRAKVNALLLHEFAHDRVSNHLSEDYHDEMATLGARLAELFATEPRSLGGAE